MPGFDRSGPTGSGSMTGRARGLCTTAGPGRGETNQSPGHGRAMPCRRGSASAQPLRNRWRSAGVPAQQLDTKEALRAQAETLQQSLEEIQQRLHDLG